MSASPSRGTSSQRRIREDVRDGAMVMAFSGLASTAVAMALLLLVRLAG